MENIDSSVPHPLPNSPETVAPIEDSPLQKEFLEEVIDPVRGYTVGDIITCAYRGQMGIVEILSELFKDRFSAEVTGSQMTFYKWQGCIWEKDDRGEYRDTDKELDALFSQALAAIPDDKKTKSLRAAVSQARSLVQSCRTFEGICKRAVFGKDGCSIPARIWDNDVLTLTTPNGIVDLRTGAVRDALPSDYRRKSTAVELLPREYLPEPELWIQTLKTIFEPLGMPNESEKLELEELRLNVEELQKEVEALRQKESLADGFVFDPDEEERERTRRTSKLDQAEEALRQAQTAFVEKQEKWPSSVYLEQVISFLQRLLGYCLLGTNQEQKFIIFVGDKGRNGKGVICHVLREILRDYACEARSELFMKTRQKGSGDATPELMNLQGKRLVIGSENDRGDALNASFVKRVTGGDQLSGRALYREEQTFNVGFVPVLLTNYFPHIDTEDQALLTRCICIPFMRTFKEDPDPENVFEGRIDTTLETRLKEEYHAIFGWLVEGARLYLQEGRLDIPEVIRFSGDTYRACKDTLRAFIDECCIEEGEDKDAKKELTVSSSEVYFAYAQWCEENGLKAASRPTFKERMTSKGYQYIKNSSIYLRGLALNDSGAELCRAYESRKRPRPYC